MNINRIYDPVMEDQAALFPRFDVSDAVGSRAALNEFLEGLEAQGIERPTDDRIEEIERTIPGPDGAPDVPTAFLISRLAPTNLIAFKTPIAVDSLILPKPRRHPYFQALCMSSLSVDLSHPASPAYQPLGRPS